MSGIEYQTLKLEKHGDVEWLTLNRPERLNTLTAQMAEELYDYFHGQFRQPTCRVIMLSGAGAHFCAGYDMAKMDDIPETGSKMLNTQKSWSEVVLTMRRCPQPIIALLHGAAAGGGFALSLAADVRIAAENARMNVAMAKVGLTGCDMGISYHLPRVIGASNAAEMMMTGRFCDAPKALRLGLVSDVVPLEALRDAGQKLCDEMLVLSPLGLRLTKEGLNRSLEAPSLEAALVVEDRGQALVMGESMREGMRAFLEKRAPAHTSK